MGPMAKIIMKYSYALTPFLAWVLAGFLKYVIRSIQSKNWKFSGLGYGGMPSNHTAIVISMTSLIAMNEGIETASFGISLTFSFVIIMDAMGLRRFIGEQSKAINQITQNMSNPMKERMGHKLSEVLAGGLIGFLVAFLMHSFKI